MGALPAVGRRAAARVLREGAQSVAASPARCGAPGCDRPPFSAEGCAWHALGGRYRTVVAPGGCLGVARVEEPPRRFVEALR